jgi:hypothetical protein
VWKQVKKADPEPFKIVEEAMADEEVAAPVKAP